jgi:hypothetical protein
MLGARELVHIFVCKGKSAIIMQKILGATVQILDYWKTSRPGLCTPAIVCRSYLILKTRRVVCTKCIKWISNNGCPVFPSSCLSSETSEHILITFIFGDSRDVLKSNFSCVMYPGIIACNLHDTQFPKNVSQKSIT